MRGYVPYFQRREYLSFRPVRFPSTPVHNFLLGYTFFCLTFSDLPTRHLQTVTPRTPRPPNIFSQRNNGAAAPSPGHHEALHVSGPAPLRDGIRDAVGLARVVEARAARVQQRPILFLSEDDGFEARARRRRRGGLVDRFLVERRSGECHEDQGEGKLCGERGGERGWVGRRPSDPGPTKRVLSVFFEMKTGLLPGTSSPWVP